MRVTLLGHASLLVETSDVTILTDPTFQDADDLGHFSPRRRLSPGALPPIDILYISHIHSDHFHVESLATLVDNVDTVVAPTDDNILDALDVLGFASVQPIKDGQAITTGDTKLRFTPSRFKVPEHGLLISDASGRVWNQVDTLADPEWAPNLHKDGPIDVHFANFMPLSWYHGLVGGVWTFPYAVYQEQFDAVRSAKAKLVVPASSGMTFREPYDYMNRYWFPMAHERFAADVRSVMDAEAEVLCPGDVVEIKDHIPRVLRQAVPDLVSTIDPSMDEFRFNPTAAIPPLTDHNPRSIANAELEVAVDEVLAKIDTALRTPAKQPLLDRLRPWNAKMLITVHFPDRTAHWSIDLTSPSPAVSPGQDKTTNFFFETTASGLHGVERALCWDEFFYFGYRAFHTVYTVRDEGIFSPASPDQGRIGVGAIPLPHDLVFSLWEPTPKPWIMRRARACAQGDTP